MATCYDCGERIIGGSGIRRSVQTGFSAGQRSSRVYYRNVLLCSGCAAIRHKQDEQANRIYRIVFGIVLAFFGTAWVVGRNVSSGERALKNPASQPTPTSSISSEVETTFRDQHAIDRRTALTPSVESFEAAPKFLVRANEGYANLRSSASTEAASLAKVPNGTSVEILSQETNSSGQLWYEVQIDKQKGWIYSELIEKSQL